MPEVAYRKSPKLQSHPEALAAWLRKAELEGRKQNCGTYDEATFTAALGQLKQVTLAAPKVWYSAIREACNACGVAYLILPELPGTRVSGAVRQITDECKLIVQTGRYRDDGHFWFTFFHEARHVLQGKLRREWLVEDESTDDPLEKDANHFAREFLIPTAAIRTVRQQHAGKMPLQAAQELAVRLGIAPGIVAGRFQHDKIWPQDMGNQLKRRFTADELLGAIPSES